MLLPTRRLIAFTSIAVAGLFAMPVLAAPCVNGINISGTCEVPSGMNRMQVEMWGGGGGGGGASLVTEDPAAGGGGGGFCGTTLATTPGQIVEITVGQPGRQGSLGEDGSSGGGSSIRHEGLMLIAEGGQGGPAGHGAAVPGGDGGFCNSAAFPAASAYRGGRGGSVAPTSAAGGGGGGSGTATADGQDAIGGLRGVPFGANGGLGNGDDGLSPGGGGGGSGGAGIAGGEGGAGWVRLTFIFVAPPVVAPTAPAPIPTLEQRGLLILAVLIGAAPALNRRKRN